MTYVKINDTLYPADVRGRVKDADWDNRESKAITLSGSFDEVNALLVDGTEWSIKDIVRKPAVDANGSPILDENGNLTYVEEEIEYDNSEFCIRGDLTVHVDGTCTVKMGKPTDLEDAYELLYGGM